MIRAEPLYAGGALRLVLDRPKANVLDAAMIASLHDALATHVQPQTRLLVLEGAGRHFSFGASVQEHTADQAPAMLEAFHGLFYALAEHSIPTCALVRGQCLGGGLELASWCSHVIAHPDAKLGQPEIKLAVFPPMASLLLPWRAGGGAALDLCLSGRSATAAEAHRLGIVDELADDPEAAWRAWYEQHLADRSAAALRHAERAARRTLVHAMQTHLAELERQYLAELMATHDANEGLAAFLERRPPTFQHR